MRIQVAWNAMDATAMTRTPAATVLAAYSLTGFGKLNTHLVYRFDRLFAPGPRSGRG